MKSFPRKFTFLRPIVIGLAVFILAVLSCREQAPTPVFDGQRAYELLIMQTDLGPRNPNSEGWRQFQIILAGFFDSLGVVYERQEFDYFDYLASDTLSMVNWIARINPDKSERVLVLAHYDCRPHAEYDPDMERRKEPILGANDGASGVAVLMHMAELMVTSPPSIGVDLLFTDGEDYGPPGRMDQYLLGATHFASVNTREYRFGLLLDMIGDSDLRIPREKLSDRYAKDINDKVWAAAARLGYSQFVDIPGKEVQDDHLPLIAAGIPTVDIIDFDYLYWHTHADTPDKCSPASLEAVGRVVMDVIYGE